MAIYHLEKSCMKLSKSDFRLMRWSFSMICTSILLSGVILYSSSKYAESAKKNLHTAQKKMNDARKRLTLAREDLENLSDYSQEYDKLEHGNILGDDHRLDWIDELEKLRNQNLVVDFRYNIAPQKQYAPQPALDSGNFDIHYSETKLQFDLLHGGQLFNFFEALRKLGNGWYQLEGCTMQRIIASEADATSAVPHIKAECTGGWITLKNRNTKP
jgi:hypothetical protein